MKKTTCLILAVFAAIICFCQSGLTGYGNADNSNINQLKSAINTYIITTDWNAHETAENVWNWSKIDGYLANCKVNNIKAEFMFYTGYSAPAYLYQKGVPKVTTTSNVFPYYPYYKNAYYKARFKNMLLQVHNHIKNSPYFETVFMWWSAEGASGDESPYKGDPTNPAYNITDEEWKLWKHEVWLYMDSLLNTIPDKHIRLGINPSNDGENFAWGVAHLREVGLKYGNYGHNIFFPGNYYGAIRLTQLDTTDSRYKHLSRSEMQQVYKSAFWQNSPAAMTWAMTVNAIHGGLKQLNISAATLTQNTGDLNVYSEFNEFAPLRRADKSDRGVIFLGHPINLTDSVWYDKLTYGNLVANSDLAVYNNKYENQVTNNTEDSLDKKQFLATGLMVDYFNQARRTAIYANHPGATYNGLIQGNNNDTWGTDANIFGVNSYGKFGTHTNYSQSKLLFKVGVTSTGKFGRFAETFDAAHHDMFFDIDDDFNIGGGLIIEVTYYDTGTGRWRLAYNNGRITHSKRVECTNTNKWLTATFTIPGFVANGLGFEDFALEWLRGTEPPFQMIKFRRIDALN